MILFDFHCLNTECSHTFEDLVSADEMNPPCPLCCYLTEKVAFCNHPTLEHNPKQAEIMMKGANMRNKWIGKVPWRKCSESQSS